MGWILCPKFESTDAERVRDLMVFPELRWIDRFYLVPPLLFNAALWWLFGPAVFVWAGLVGTVMSWHLLFTANSVCHLYGWRRFDTGEGSRNNPILGVLLLGEGWHNNHHRLASAARQGFYWWEIDLSYYLLRLLQALRIVWEVREVPAHVLDEGRKLLRN
jgi:stearoyl-CoA desaturase (delta-9 desaturase)